MMIMIAMYIPKSLGGKREKEKVKKVDKMKWGRKGSGEGSERVINEWECCVVVYFWVSMHRAEIPTYYLSLLREASIIFFPLSLPLFLINFCLLFSFFFYPFDFVLLSFTLFLFALFFC